MATSSCEAERREGGGSEGVGPVEAAIENVHVEQREGGDSALQGQEERRTESHITSAPPLESASSEDTRPLLPPLGQSLQLLAESSAEFGPFNHLKGCKWAPDGTCLLAASADCKMRLYNLPPELYSGPVTHQLPDMCPVLTLALGEVVYDYCWYPLMSSWEPASACFATSCKDHPVQLWDAFDLQKRATYAPHNQLDELATPHSLCFSLDGQRLFCGFNKCVRVFETGRPGRECHTLSTQEKQWGGQRGIVSCIAMLPTQPDNFAVGSYSGQVGLYSERSPEAMLLLTGLGGGVTHMDFSPDGNLLFVGFRKSNELKVWDLRNPGNQLAQLHRPVHTNQRVYFDLYNECYLLSGSTCGQVLGWDVSSLAAVSPPPLLSHTAHSDAVTGCSIHPSLPLLATSSGQRHFPLPGGSDDSASEEDVPTDNSLRLWSLAGQPQSEASALSLHNSSCSS